MGVSFIWKLKATRFQNPLDLYYDQRIWRRNDFANLDNAVLLPPKNALFAPLLGKKPFLTMTKMKTLFQMTYTIKMVRPRQFIEPGLGVSTYLDFGARLFSTQWPPNGAHILQGLINKVLSCQILKESDRHRETDVIAKVKINACPSGKVYQFITELEEASCLTLRSHRGDATFNGPKSTWSGVRFCHHRSEEKIARLQNAAQSTSHRFSRFQVVLTIRFFKFLIELAFWVLWEL